MPSQPVSAKGEGFEILEVSNTFMISNEWFKYFKITERNSALFIFIITPGIHSLFPTVEYFLKTKI